MNRVVKWKVIRGSMRMWVVIGGGVNRIMMWEVIRGSMRMPAVECGRPLLDFWKLAPLPEF